MMFIKVLFMHQLKTAD